MNLNNDLFLQIFDTITDSYFEEFEFDELQSLDELTKYVWKTYYNNFKNK